MATDSLASVDLPDNQLVVILTTERCQVRLVGREGQTLNEYFVKLQSVFDFEGVEVPNDDVGLYEEVAD